MTKFIELAGEVDTAMPAHVVNRTVESLNSIRKSINGSRILLVGLAYKANVDDMSESPTFVPMDKFKSRGAVVDYHDPYIPMIAPTREHGHWTGAKSFDWTRETLSAYYAVIISTAHGITDFRQLAQWAPLIVDTRNALHGIAVRPSQLWKS